MLDCLGKGISLEIYCVRDEIFHPLLSQILTVNFPGIHVRFEKILKI